jgi:N6-L-threonylcarbamoyladenine synthase
LTPLGMSMRIVLGIESSCDETAVALVREDKTILAQALASQTDVHAPYGGVVPEIAARAHLQQIDRLYMQALKSAGVTLPEVDAIAVTTGPGLIGGVIVGAMFAKALAAAAGKPLIAINHLEGHALTVRLVTEVAFPYFLLLVSGGHCQMLVVRGVGDYQLIGATKDDALGEAFDKTAKMLGLPYPGGPELEKAAARGLAKYPLPRPMHGAEHADMSFSGLKTAVRLLVQKETSQAPMRAELVNDIAASFQQTVLDIVRDRVEVGLTLAKRICPEVSALAVAGGVAANQALRAALADIAGAHGLPMVVAPQALCTDNAAMIAWAGMERLMLGVSDPLDVDPRARWPLAERTA